MAEANSNHEQIEQTQNDSNQINSKLAKKTTNKGRKKQEMSKERKENLFESQFLVDFEEKILNKPENFVGQTLIQ